MLYRQDSKKRCIQCNKIIVGNSKLSLCPKCADKDARGAVVGITALGSIAFVAKIAWKPDIQAIKGVVKIITKT